MLALAALPTFSKDDGKKKHYKKFASDKSKVTFTVVLFSSLVQSILFCNSAFSTAQKCVISVSFPMAVINPPERKLAKRTYVHLL